MSALAPAYRPRRPTETVLYQVVREHLETFLAHARESYEAPLPRYVENELRRYMRCGVFAHGFVRAHCDACGHDLLVAFSCKGRGVCPSCTGRRMADTAAHLVDRVLPAVPMRQWVLSLPFELRALAAFRADVLSKLSRIFVEAVFARYRSQARRDGLEGVAPGAVTHVQRFGSSINLNVHFHSMFLDGVFTRDAQGRPVFHAAPAPSREELTQIVHRVCRRTIGWLDRNGHLASPGARPQETSTTALDACATIALQRGTVLALRGDASSDQVALPGIEPPPVDGDAVEHGGFNLHAGVAIAADDDLGRERLMRYGARPPLALDRLRRLPGARIAYRIKRLRDGRAKNRVMTPLDLLARLAAIVPPPRYPLLRYHGVMAPRSSWRRDIVPRIPAGSAPKRCSGGEAPERQAAPRQRVDEHAKHAAVLASAGPATKSPDPSRAFSRTGREPGASTSEEAVRTQPTWIAPNILSVKHWTRLLGGLLYAASPRVDWATLLRRSFDVDVLRCSACGGRMRVLAEVVEPALVRLVLEAVGLPTEAPVAARARDPTELLGAADAC